MRSPVAPVRLCLALGMIPLLFGITAPRATAVTYTKLTVYFADEQDTPILTGTFVASADDGSFVPANTQTTSAQGYAYFDYVPVGSTITLSRQDTPPDGYETITLHTEASGPVPAEPELTFPFRYDPVAGVNRIVYLQQRVIATAPTPTPEPPTATATSSPTSTLTPTATATASPTPTSTATPTATNTPLPPTETPSPTPTLTPAPATSTPSPTSTATVTASPTQTATATTTHTATPPPSTETPFPTPTLTPTETALPTQTPTATASPTATLSPPDTPSPTSTDTSTATSTPTATLTPVLSSETATAEPSATPTETPPSTPTSTVVISPIPPTATSDSATGDETTTPAPATATLDLAPSATATPTQEGGEAPTVAPLVYGSVIVTYTDTNGVGVSGSWFQLNAADCQAPFRPARVTDSSGSVRFERIPLGSYCLAQARPAEGYAPVSQRQIVVDREQVPVVVGATWLGATPTPLPTEEPIPDTTGAAPELEILVWRCAGLPGSRPPVFEVFAPDAHEDDDGTSGIRTGGIDCVPTATDLLIYPFGSMDGTVADPIPVHVSANGRILISDGLAPTSGRTPHLLSEPLSGALATFELKSAARTRVTLVLGGFAPHPDTAGPPVLTLPATGSGRYPGIGHFLFLFLPGTLLVALLGCLTIRARRRILRSRL